MAGKYLKWSTRYGRGISSVELCEFIFSRERRIAEEYFHNVKGTILEINRSGVLYYEN
jgi:hypothetical protein